MDYQLITLGVIAISGKVYLTYLDHRYKKRTDKFYNERIPEHIVSAQKLELKVKEEFQNIFNKIDDMENGRR